MTGQFSKWSVAANLPERASNKFSHEPCVCRNSPFVNRCLARLADFSNLDVLDIPSGFGRHSLFLATWGNRVTAVDISKERLEASEETWASLVPPKGWYRTKMSDIEEELSFDQMSYDLVLVIHYVSKTILSRVRGLVRIGGHLIFETYGAQGHNWKGLPIPGETQSQLAGFSILDIREQLVLREGKQKVTVKLFAQRVE